MFKKWDIIVILLLILLSFTPEIILGVVMGKSYNSTYAEVTVEGKLYKKILLSAHKGYEEFKVQTEEGYNIVIVKDNTIAIIEADCPDKVCIKPGFISRPGESLVCLPHKVMVEVKGDINPDDIITSF